MTNKTWSSIELAKLRNAKESQLVFEMKFDTTFTHKYLSKALSNTSNIYSKTFNISFIFHSSFIIATHAACYLIPKR